MEKKKKIRRGKEEVREKRRSKGGHGGEEKEVKIRKGGERKGRTGR